MWWENEPLQSLSKSGEQTQKRRKIALPQKRAHILVSQINGLAWTIWFLRQNFQFSLLNGEYGTPDFLEAGILGAGWKTQVPIVLFPFARNFASLYQERDKNTKCTVELTKKTPKSMTWMLWCVVMFYIQHKHKNSNIYNIVFIPFLCSQNHLEFLIFIMALTKMVLVWVLS